MAIKKTIEDAILEVLRDGMDDDLFRGYFYGDPIAIPKSALPAIIVDVEKSNQEVGPTGMDREDTTIIIKVVLDKRDDFGQNDVQVMKNGTLVRLRQFCEARDSVTNEYLSNTIIGLLRKNFTLTNTLTNQVIDVEYGTAARPQDIITAEAQITFNASQLIPVTGRT